MHFSVFIKVIKIVQKCVLCPKLRINYYKKFT